MSMLIFKKMCYLFCFELYLILKMFRRIKLDFLKNHIFILLYFIPSSFKSFFFNIFSLLKL